MEPRDLSIHEAGRQLAARHLSAVDLVSSVLDQIDRVDGEINAYITVRPGSDLIGEATESDARRSRGESQGPLEGVPVSLKDNFETVGMRTTVGSKVLADWL